MDPRSKPAKLTDAIDLSKLDVAIKTPEKPAEREARLLRQTQDAAHERRKDYQLFVASLMVVTVSALCYLVALFLTPANSAWAAPLLTPIVGGMVGYQTGKSQKPKGDP